jgi:hemoglobin
MGKSIFKKLQWSFSSFGQKLPSDEKGQKESGLHKKTNNIINGGGNNACCNSSCGGFDNGFLLDRLGGTKVLDSLVDDFLGRVGSDAKLNGFFTGTDMTALASHQKRFLTLAFTKIPQSVDVMIKNRHQHLFARGLHEGHFDLVAQHLEASMKSLLVDQAHIEEAMGIVAPLRVVFEEGAREAVNANLSNGWADMAFVD